VTVQIRRYLVLRSRFALACSFLTHAPAHHQGWLTRPRSGVRRL